MSWLGKILGGGLGFALGGPIGAVLGAVAGHQLVDRSDSTFSDTETRQSIYFVATFSMLGKLAKADGQVTPDEVATIEQVMRDNMRLSPEARQFAIDVFSAAKTSEQPFIDFARQFRDEFAGSPEIMVSIVELLLLVAFADGSLHREERQMIEQAVEVMGISRREYERILARFDNSGNIHHAFGVLDSNESDDLATIKKRYRKLAMQYHPDRIQAKGMSPEFALLAEEKFKEIQQAYDEVEKYKGHRARD